VAFGHTADEQAAERELSAPTIARFLDAFNALRAESEAITARLRAESEAKKAGAAAADCTR
jgi:hypothetical protein